MTETPALVSIIIPTKNRGVLLRETLNSVCAQTYPHWEAIVVDDGSTDETEALAVSLGVTEPRIRFNRVKGVNQRGQRFTLDSAAKPPVS